MTITITITTAEKDVAGVKAGGKLYYIIRESGKRISPYYASEKNALQYAWFLIRKYGFTLVEPW